MFIQELKHSWQKYLFTFLIRIKSTTNHTKTKGFLHVSAPQLTRKSILQITNHIPSHLHRKALSPCTSAPLLADIPQLISLLACRRNNMPSPGCIQECLAQEGSRWRQADL